jgi:MYXO-CTERM domain-containing protein
MERLPTQHKESFKMQAQLRPIALALSLLLAPMAASAQSTGSARVTTQVVGFFSPSDSHTTSVFVLNGPATANDAVVASVPNAPANHVYAESNAFANWQPGSVKTSAYAAINGLCVPLSGGGCDGPATTRAGATASASSLTFADPGVSVPTVVHNNLSLDGWVNRTANFLSAYTQSLYVNGTVPDAMATFNYRIDQLQFNKDGGRDVFANLASGSVVLDSYFDGTTTVTTAGFLQQPTWTGAPLALTTPDYTLMPGKTIQVQLSVQLDTGLLYSLVSADTVVSDLGFANTFRFSTDPSAPAFAGTGPVTIPSLYIDNGVYAVPVSEPGSGTLAAAGLVVLLGAWMRRRREEQRSAACCAERFMMGTASVPLAVPRLVAAT